MKLCLVMESKLQSSFQLALFPGPAQLSVLIAMESAGWDLGTRLVSSYIALRH